MKYSVVQLYIYLDKKSRFFLRLTGTSFNEFDRNSQPKERARSRSSALGPGAGVRVFHQPSL